MEREAVGAGVTAALFIPYLWWQSRRTALEVVRYKAAFDNTPTPLFLKNPAGLVVAVNEAFVDTFGVSMDDLNGLTADQQHALWATSPAVNFAETDELAYKADEPIYAVAHLVPPHPHRSTLMNPHVPQEYYIRKRRFAVRTLISHEYWIIGSIKSIELMIQFADKARSRYEELQMKSPILSAIHDLKDVVQNGFSDGSDRMSRIESRLDKTEHDLRTLHGSEKTQPLGTQFDSFIEPS